MAWLWILALAALVVGLYVLNLQRVEPPPSCNTCPNKKNVLWKIFRVQYQMNYMYILTTAILFYLLSPGVLISLPPGSSHMVQLATHAIVFAVVHKYVQHGLLKQR